MSKKLLDERAVEELRNSPHVASVSERSVSFTPVCKELLYQRMSGGERLTQVLESLGIDTAALGEARVKGLEEKLRRYAARPEGFQDGKGKRREKSPEEREQTLEAKVKVLESEVVFLRQTVEFLKKKKQLEMEVGR